MGSKALDPYDPEGDDWAAGWILQKIYKTNPEVLVDFVPDGSGWFVAPSALNVCPDNLSNYYKPYKCLMGLSLRERSILIFILDKNKSKVIIFEKINLGGRLRHFGIDRAGKLFVDSNNYFYISMDKDGLYKIKFDNFR